jgi:hypothetical protein
MPQGWACDNHGHKSSDIARMREALEDIADNSDDPASRRIAQSALSPLRRAGRSPVLKSGRSRGWMREEERW